MERRKFLSTVSMISAVSLAGCNSNDAEESTETNESVTNNSSSTETQSTEQSTETEQEYPYETPQTMTELAKFGYNVFQEQLRTQSFELKRSIESGNDADGDSSQTMTFKYDADNKESLFIRETDFGTIQEYSSDGLVYSRIQSPNGNITYDKYQVEDSNQVKLYGGFEYIDSLHGNGVKVAEPVVLDNPNLVSYEFTEDPSYDSVEGEIVLNRQTGLFERVALSGETAVEFYDTELTYTYEESVTVDVPAWVRDMEEYQ